MPAKKVINDVETEVEVSQTTSAETKKLKAENTKLKKNIEALSSELEEVKKMIASLNNAEPAKTVTQESISNEDILVCSLCSGTLSIGTESYGRGIIYHFSKFGEEQEIPYGDLRDIVRNNRSFAESGAFYIENDKAIKKLRLGQAYKRCLNVEEMKSIMSQPADKFMELYDRATEMQRDNIIGMIIDAKLEGKFIDANIISQVSQRSGKNLTDYFD